MAPGVFVEAPLWHLDTAVNSLSRRRAKAEAYELERPGMKVGGRAHNHAFYLPELARDASVATVPEDERAWIEDVIAADFVAAGTRRASLDFASVGEIDLAWPGTPHRGTLHRGQISAVAVPGVLRGGRAGDHRRPRDQPQRADLAAGERMRGPRSGSRIAGVRTVSPFRNRPRCGRPCRPISLPEPPS